MDVSEDRCETDADGYSHAALIYGYAHSHSLPEGEGQQQMHVEVLVGMHYAVYGHTLDQTQNP